MPEPKTKYRYNDIEVGEGLVSSLPFLPLTLSYQARSINVSGLLDTGATVNVLPYQIGIELGATWQAQTTNIRLTGNLARLETRGLLVTAQVGKFSPVRLAFAWVEADDVPIILGQVNFFREFDLCFYGSQYQFEIRPKTKGK